MRQEKTFYYTGSVETTRTQEEERQKLWLSKVKENHCGVTISTCTCIQRLDKKIIVYSKYECYMFNELDIFYCCNSLPEGLGKFSFSWNSKNINNIFLQFNVYSLIDCLNIVCLCSVIQLMVISFFPSSWELCYSGSLAGATTVSLINDEDPPSI